MMMMMTTVIKSD